MNPTPSHTERNYQLQLLILTLIVNCSGLFVTILGPDGALYASIAKTMETRNDFISLFAEGSDWLDKPHFPFWITAFSFKLFGVTTWAYKLPAILFLFMGARYTFLLAAKLYDERTAWWSAIILLTAEHIIISNNDVRAEPYLTGLIIAAVYHFYRAKQVNNYWHLTAGALFAACAVMTKGMFALIPVCGAIGLELIIKKEWKQLFHVRWLIAVLLISLFIAPELYCLYYQFDLHPEKIVFGRTGVSGLRFFFWDSQFGRFFNTGPIKGSGDPFFFLHTLLWAFLPWSVMMYVALFQKIKNRLRNPTAQEWYTLGGFLPCILLFSLSKFQLPHYSNILFPFISILTAQYLLLSHTPITKKLIRVIQTTIVMLLSVLVVALHIVFEPGYTVLAIGLACVAIAGWFLLPLRKWAAGNRMGPAIYTVWAIMWVNLYLNLFFYPALLHYQSGSEAAMFVNRNYTNMPVVQLRKDYSYALEFYLHQQLYTVNDLADTVQLPHRPFLVYIAAENTAPVNGEVISSFENFHVSRLTFRLLNHTTRSQETGAYRVYLVR
ncbi:MAG: glycosyltransferase family 39 protein [Chitinophagaceae bacterium]